MGKFKKKSQKIYYLIFVPKESVIEYFKGMAIRGLSK
jgi:hypothetical protein